jgi:SAM-dependent methyltransferase
VAESRARTGDYGIDAPGMLRGIFLTAAAGAVLLAVALYAGLPHWLVDVAAVLTVYAGLVGVAHVWLSRVGKLRERVRLVNRAALRGDERVLDVGCGRGLLLNEAAARLTSGGAVGVDLWSGRDQSGNTADATFENARVEGVADRINVCTGDARALPFAGGSIDVVVSSIALHNIRGEHGRRQAVREIDRVLRPGGRLVLLDLRKTDDYAATLRDLGWADVARIGPVWWMFVSRYVTGSKPPRALAER